MKLNINAKELLALHNLLYERFAGSHAHDECEYKDGDGPPADEVQLRQVYNRLRACIVAALTGKAVDPFDAWKDKEQARIDRLKEELEDVKKDQTELSQALTPDDFNGDDFTAPEYPRRGPRGPRGQRGGGKR